MSTDVSRYLPYAQYTKTGPPARTGTFRASFEVASGSAFYSFGDSLSLRSIESGAYLSNKAWYALPTSCTISLACIALLCFAKACLEQYRAVQQAPKAASAVISSSFKELSCLISDTSIHSLAVENVLPNSLGVQLLPS